MEVNNDSYQEEVNRLENEGGVINPAKPAPQKDSFISALLKKINDLLKRFVS